MSILSPYLLQVLNDMYEKAVSFETMDYQLVFWGYTFAIKKLTWFAQVRIESKQIWSTLS